MFGLPLPAALAKPLLYALVAVAILLFGRWWGASGVYKEWLQANETAQIQAVKIIDRQHVVTERVRIQYRDRVVQLEGVNTTIEKEVINYVEGKPLTAACMLDARWVQLHDAAAAGAVPPASTGADGAAAGITAAQALPTITGNYGAANKIRERLIGLQKWVREQYQATNGESLPLVAQPP